MGSIIEEKYAKSVADCDFIGDVRGKGLMWGFEFVKDKNPKNPLPAKKT